MAGRGISNGPKTSSGIPDDALLEGEEIAPPVDDAVVERVRDHPRSEPGRERLTGHHLGVGRARPNHGEAVAADQHFRDERTGVVF